MSNTTSALKKVGTLIGVRDLVFVKLTADDSTGHTYDTTYYQAPGVIEVALTAQVSEDQLGANDIALYDIVNAKDGYEVNITQASLGTDMTSLLLGSTLDSKGVEIEESDDLAPYVAMGFKAARSDGSDDYIWLYKGRFAPGDETFHTKEKGTVNWQTPTLKGVFGPRVHDNRIRCRVNSADSSAASIIETFFSSVYEKTTGNG